MTTWLAKVRTASFRGVPLPAPDGVTTEHTPRTADHEYPGIPGGWVEHLDRGLRSWSLTVILSGASYMSDRDTLEAALDLPEPGLLVHPTRGELQASVVGPYTVSEADGRATFQITFRESGRPTTQTAGKPSTGSALLSRVESAVSAVSGAFADAFDLDGLPAWAQAETIATVRGQVETIRETMTGAVGQLATGAAAIVAELRDLEDEVADLIDQPDVLAARYAEVLRQVQHLAVYRALTSDAGIPDATAGTAPVDTSVAEATTANARALVRLALAAWGETVQGTTWESYDEAAAESAVLVDRLAAEEACADGDEYEALVGLRIALAAYMAAQSTRLPRLRTVQQSSPASILEIAQRWHADGDRADEIALRNGLLDCGWATGDLLILGAA